MYQFDAILWLSIFSFLAVFMLSVVIHLIIDDHGINKAVAWIFTFILAVIFPTVTLLPLNSSTVNHTLADHSGHYINLTPQIATQPGQFRYDVTADGDPVETYLVTRTVQVVDSQQLPLHKEVTVGDKGVTIDGTTYAYDDERISIKWSITQDTIVKTNIIGHELWVEDTNPEKPSTLNMTIVFEDEKNDQWYKNRE